MHKKVFFIMSVLTSLFLVGCSGIIPDAHRIDIPQGNLLTEDKVKQVEVGMNRRQVQRLLGSPLLVDTFNQNRWDYFYSVNTKEGTSIKYHITVTFKNNLVAHITQS